MADSILKGCKRCYTIRGVGFSDTKKRLAKSVQRSKMTLLAEKKVLAARMVFVGAVFRQDRKKRIAAGLF